MSFAAMLNDRCHIYHAEPCPESVGFGISDQMKYTYNREAGPDVADVPCHFHRRLWAAVPVAAAPAWELPVQVQLDLPIGTDIRIGDLVIDRRTDLEYTAGAPVNIRAHHMRVMLSRMPLQEQL